MPKHSDSDDDGERLVDRPARDHASVPQQERVGEPARDLVDVVGDEDERRARVVVRERSEPRHEVLAGAEVETGGGLVEDAAAPGRP